MPMFLKRKVLDMEEYEINSETLAILPIGEEKSRIIEVSREIIVNVPPIKVIDDSCKFFGSSYEGRFSGTKTLIGISHKSPIIIEESRKIIFFPTSSPRLLKCAWISLNNIESYIKNNGNTIIRFNCGKTVEIELGYGVIDNQVLRATRLEAVLSKRIESYFKGI